MPPRAKTIAQLRRELAARERQLDKLLAQRGKIDAALQALDRKIMAIGGEIPFGGAKRGRVAKPSAARRGRRGPRTGKPLVAYIRQVLAAAPKGMRAIEVKDAVIAAGYSSKSSDFARIVAATLRKTPGIKRVSRGVYKLVKRR